MKYVWSLGSDGANGGGFMRLLLRLWPAKDTNMHMRPWVGPLICTSLDDAAIAVEAIIRQGGDLWEAWEVLGEKDGKWEVMTRYEETP